MDDGYSRILGSPPMATNKQSPLMQFNKIDSGGQIDFKHVSNNNNDNHLFTKHSIETNPQDKNSIERLTSSSSPHPSSNSSVSSHALYNNDCDTAAQMNNGSSPPSPQLSSYNSSYGSNCGRKLMNISNNSVTALVPGGVVTTQNISTVIRPRSNNNSLQFVKIQTPELSKTAVEQIRMAQETKISKDKIKEVEEEWQSNLLNWKSKRRQQFSHTIEQEPNDLFENNDSLGGRKIKTFAEMIEQRAKSGNRLGFHLQRYIGEDEDELDKATSANFRDPRDYLNQHNQAKNRSDSDCEVHSSNSSGINHLDSKSPSSLDPPLNMSKNLSQASNSSGLNTGSCDKDTDDLQHDERNNHSISIVDDSESDRLSSTLKQDLQPPQRNSGYKSTPILDVDIKTNEVSARSEDESDQSGPEDEEEEEEEQKHLQRVAFEAKLKAFEKMTNPTMPTPKFTPPPRVVKPKPVPIKREPESILIKRSPPMPKPSELPTSFRHPIKNNSIQSPSGSQEVTSSIIKNEPTSRIEPKNQFVDECKTSQRPEVKFDINPTPPDALNVQPSGPAQRIDCFDSPRLGEVEPKFVSLMSNMDLNRKPAISSVHVSQEACMQNLIRVDPKDTQISAAQQDPSIVRQLPYSNSIPINHLQAPQINPPAPMIRALNEPAHIMNSSMQGADLNQINMQKDRNLPAQPSQDSPPKNAPCQRKPTRDEKDKTVLSISGKKRCSSCKEELGRGAAAFVVESLSLVYHTNCFRCSVCHVNLSNGFRGVDVRVHAGALHCQNCYSKDGLNYSRV